MIWKHKESGGPLGLIAGEGEFPLLIAETAYGLGREVILFGVEGITDKRAEAFSKEAFYVGLGSLERLLSLLKEKKINEVVLAGAVPKKEIYNPDFKFDDTARNFVFKAQNKGDDHLLRAFKIFLKVKCGVSIVDSRVILKKMLAPKGVMTRRAPSGEEWKDLKFGYKIAKGIGKLDIGQTVVVKQGLVLAVEALEGTDQAIRRGGELGQKDAVVVKVAKPNQDLSMDLPCIGIETLEALKSAGSKVLGVEAGKSITLYKDKLIETADRYGMTLVGL